MRTEPPVSVADERQYSVLNEKEADLSGHDTCTKTELNNNVEDNKKHSTDTKTLEKITEKNGQDPTSTTPPTATKTNTPSGKKHGKKVDGRARSFKGDNEELGLENVIPYHRSPKALSEMISKREAFFKSEAPSTRFEAPSTKFDPALRERDGRAEKLSTTTGVSKHNGHSHTSGSRTDPKSLIGYVGFANLPNQVYRESVKRGFEFTLMVVGESGLGKSTLINSLFLTDLYNEKNLAPSRRPPKTLEINSSQVLLKEGGVQLKLTVVDTPGFGDAVDNNECWNPVLHYINTKFEEYLNGESKVNRKPSPDNRVHCCLYFIAPTGHGLKALDIEFMKRLHDKVNIVPLIAKADTLTPEELRDFKVAVLNEIAKHNIRIYEFPDVGDEDESKTLKKLKDRVPFAVVGSNKVMDVNGKKVRGRQYPWGLVEVDNLQHNDFLALRDMLIRTHMQDLRDVTSNVHYENYRYTKLASVSVSDGKVKDGSKDPLTQMEDERKEHRQKMKKMEAEMEQVFESKVKEKMQKLKDSEADLQRRAAQMKKSLDQQREELDSKRTAFLEERSLWESQNRPEETMKKNKKSLF